MGRTARVTREQVLTAAREEFVTRGFEGATLSAIGAKLGISPAAVLRHAPTKRELFAASMRPSTADMEPLAFLEKLEKRRNLLQQQREDIEVMLNEVDFFAGQCKRLLEPSQIRGFDDRGLVGQHMQAGFESRDDPLDLAAVAAREDGDTARQLVSHPVEKIGAGMHVEAPIGGGS